MFFNNSKNQLTLPEIIMLHIEEFEASEIRMDMITGDRYYQVKNDILNRKMYRYEEGERKVEDETKANNKLAHGYMKVMVDEKVGYIFGKPYSLKCEDEKYTEQVSDTLGKNFLNTLASLAREASNKGIAWLQVYFDEKGKLKFKKHKSEQIIPLWVDDEHTILQSLIRFYEQEYYEGKEKKDRIKIEYYDTEQVIYYVIEDGEIKLDSEEYLKYEDTDQVIGHFQIGDQQMTFGKVPFVAFKNNELEMPDLNFIKTLIDGYDTTRSDVSNILEEIKNLIFVLYGYGGTDKAGFMRDMAYFRAILMDYDGKVETLNPQLDISAAKIHYEDIKADITEFGQSITKDKEKMGNSPSGVSLKFMYAGLDLKCNFVDNEFSQAFDNLLYFINISLGLGEDYEADMGIEFNRDIQINESEAIDNVVKSNIIISKRTQLENHPWVGDVDEELERVEKDYPPEEEDDLFGNPSNKKKESKEGDE